MIKSFLNMLTNWRLKRTMKRFKEDDYLYILAYGTGQQHTHSLFVVVGVVWLGWFRATKLYCSHPHHRTATVVLDLHRLSDYRLFPGNAKPKFDIGHPVRKNQDVFLVDKISPYVWSDGKKCAFEFRYSCINEKTDMLHSFLETELQETVNTNKVWQSINTFQA